MIVKLGNDVRRSIMKVAARLDERMANGEIPAGDILREYFDLYDLYRRSRFTHGMPKGAKNTKWRLIEFLARRMNLACRLAADPIAGARVVDHPLFSGIVLIALDERRIVSFHADEERFSWMMPIRREFVPHTVNKRAIADYLDECRSLGFTRAAQFVRETYAHDHFRKLLDLGMAA